MIRDQDLIRKLLFAIEGLPVEGVRGRDLTVEGYGYAAIMAHINMLADAGFIIAEYSKSTTNPDRIILTEIVFDLSWKGHEYLDLVRDAKIWSKTKAISNRVGATSLEMLMDIAKAVAFGMLRDQGLPI